MYPRWPTPLHLVMKWAYSSVLPHPSKAILQRDGMQPAPADVTYISLHVQVYALCQILGRHSRGAGAHEVIAVALEAGVYSCSWVTSTMQRSWLVNSGHIETYISSAASQSAGRQITAGEQQGSCHFSTRAAARNT
ncbi:hypothetical protein NDU88_003274 [Pleurodeles waltl]|uniref:Uncharacterized protein n=1 Tax=Pleurodeles waltl TaxID=8319 RepID=A0AAV7T4B9_PLEWA|nr:hypothetical protein NDU88_003274 [Pleurodeles waltl]